MMSVELTEVTPDGVDKVDRYGWTVIDRPGNLMWINKGALRVDQTYQRDATSERVSKITKAWSWVSCGVIEVSRRGDQYWVIDGQHRVLAALRRSDIMALPCIVFDVAGVKEEAQGFLNANTTHKPITAIARSKAMAVAGDPAAALVQQKLDEIGLHPSSGGGTTGGVRCMGRCLKHAKENPDLFSRVIDIVGRMCLSAKLPVSEKLIAGLWMLDSRIDGGLSDSRMEDRLHHLGAVHLLDACRRAEFLAGHKTASVWSKAILEAVNKGLRNKFTLKGGE